MISGISREYAGDLVDKAMRVIEKSLCGILIEEGTLSTARWVVESFGYVLDEGDDMLDSERKGEAGQCSSG